MNETPCIGCGVVLPEQSGPVHRYMESSPACWGMFGEVLSREYSNPRLNDIHRYTVDAYAVQHPGRPSRSSIQSVGVHLIRLCLLLEKGLEMQYANDAMLEISKRKKSFVWLPPPASLGELTVRDVWKTTTEDEHRRMVKAWALSAWQAWSVHHRTIHQWL
jgi:hypothetical protein